MEDKEHIRNQKEYSRLPKPYRKYVSPIKSSLILLFHVRHANNKNEIGNSFLEKYPSQ